MAEFTAGAVKNILVTGIPGVGKTTAVLGLANKLKRENIEVSGFYTEEIRDRGRRTGFDIINLTSGAKAPLGRVGGQQKQYKVGRYNVYLKEFERLALPILQRVAYERSKALIVFVDEIGKMELFSRKFTNYITQILNKSNVLVIATVPIKNVKGVDRIKRRHDSKLITVTVDNRKGMVDVLAREVDSIINSKAEFTGFRKVHNTPETSI